MQIKLPKPTVKKGIKIMNKNDKIEDNLFVRFFILFYGFTYLSRLTASLRKIESNQPNLILKEGSKFNISRSDL